MKGFQRRSFRPRSRTVGGVSRIVRDNYGKNAAEWYSIVNEVAKRDEVCFICNKPILKGEKWETHHVQALTRGGVTNKANLARVHSECHDLKHPHLQKRRYSR